MAKSKKRWIQKAVKTMRKDKPCTGSKFGSSSCPPGSKRYNLAKTFKAMGKKRKKKQEGGLVDVATINVERNELEVNPKTLEVVRDFFDKPEHPLIGINPRGNTMAQVGNIIIPKEYREAYLKGDNTVKQRIIALVVQRAEEGGRMQEGGGIGPDIPPTFQDSLNVMNRAVELDKFYTGVGHEKSPFDIDDPLKRIERMLPKAISETGKEKEWAEANKEDFLKKYTNVGYSRIEAEEAYNKLIGFKPEITRYTREIQDLVPDPSHWLAPSLLYDTRIKPQGIIGYSTGKGFTKGNILGNVAVTPFYDPIAVTPFSMLTEKEKIDRYKWYGSSGFPPGWKSTTVTKPKIQKSLYEKYNVGKFQEGGPIDFVFTPPTLKPHAAVSTSTKPYPGPESIEKRLSEDKAIAKYEEQKNIDIQEKAEKIHKAKYSHTGLVPSLYKSPKTYQRAAEIIETQERFRDEPVKSWGMLGAELAGMAPLLKGPWIGAKLAGKAIGMASPFGIKGAGAVGKVGKGTEPTLDELYKMTGTVPGSTYKVVPKSLPVPGVIPENPRTLWSFMDVNPKAFHNLPKTVDKTGNINVEQALNFLKKSESGGQKKYDLVRKAFPEQLPMKMNYEEFKNIVDEQIIPLKSTVYNPVYGPAIELGLNPFYGLNRIGRIETSGISSAKESYAIVLHNKEKFGLGRATHGPEETLGHVYVSIFPEEPSIAYGTQLQSSWAQKTKLGTKEEGLRGILEMENIVKRQNEMMKNAIQQPDGTWTYVGPGFRVNVADKTHKEGTFFTKEPIAQKKIEIESFEQKQLLQKANEERMLQEFISETAKRKDIKKIRIPTEETVAKIQGYKPTKQFDISKIPDDVKIKIKELELKKGIPEIEQLMNKYGTELDTKYKIPVSEIEHLTDESAYRYIKEKYSDEAANLFKNYQEYKNLYKGKGLESIISKYQKDVYPSKHQTIIDKTKIQLELLKKQKIKTEKVTDSKGVTWHEFDIPEAARKGTWQIKALGLVPPLGIGISTQGKKNIWKDKLNPIKMQEGGPILPESILSTTPSQDTNKVTPEMVEKMKQFMTLQGIAPGTQYTAPEQTITPQATQTTTPEQSVPKSGLKEYSGTFANAFAQARKDWVAGGPRNFIWYDSEWGTQYPGEEGAVGTTMKPVTKPVTVSDINVMKLSNDEVIKYAKANTLPDNVTEIDKERINNVIKGLSKPIITKPIVSEKKVFKPSITKEAKFKLPSQREQLTGKLPKRAIQPEVIQPEITRMGERLDERTQFFYRILPSLSHRTKVKPKEIIEPIGKQYPDTLPERFEQPEVIPYPYKSPGIIPIQPSTIPFYTKEIKKESLQKIDTDTFYKPDKLINKVAVNRLFANPEDSIAVFNRQLSDVNRYGKFMDKSEEIQNRTAYDRLNDSRDYIEKILSTSTTNNNLIIDIGSALGNPDNKLAGSSVKSLQDNKGIASKSTVIATDIPSEMEVWNKKENKYNIITEEIPASFIFPIDKLISKYTDRYVENVILRSANSIDLLMNKEETYNHMKDIAQKTKELKVIYLFNKDILVKEKGSDQFIKIGELNNRGFNHQYAEWKKSIGKEQPYRIFKK